MIDVTMFNKGLSDIDKQKTELLTKARKYLEGNICIINCDFYKNATSMTGENYKSKLCKIERVWLTKNPNGTMAGETIIIAEVLIQNKRTKKFTVNHPYLINIKSLKPFTPPNEQED